MATAALEDAIIEKALLFYQQHLISEKEQLEGLLLKKGKLRETEEDVFKANHLETQLKTVKSALMSIWMNSEQKHVRSTSMNSTNETTRQRIVMQQSDTEPYINPFTGQWIVPVTPFSPGPSKLAVPPESPNLNSTAAAHQANSQRDLKLPGLDATVDRSGSQSNSSMREHSGTAAIPSPPTRQPPPPPSPKFLAPLPRSMPVASRLNRADEHYGQWGFDKASQKEVTIESQMTPPSSRNGQYNLPLQSNVADQRVVESQTPILGPSRKQQSHRADNSAHQLGQQAEDTPLAQEPPTQISVNSHESNGSASNSVISPTGSNVLHHQLSNSAVQTPPDSARSTPAINTRTRPSFNPSGLRAFDDKGGIDKTNPSPAQSLLSVSDLSQSQINRDELFLPVGREQPPRASFEAKPQLLEEPQEQVPRTSTDSLDRPKSRRQFWRPGQGNDAKTPLSLPSFLNGSSITAPQQSAISTLTSFDTKGSSLDSLQNSPVEPTSPPNNHFVNFSKHTGTPSSRHGTINSPLSYEDDTSPSGPISTQTGNSRILAGAPYPATSYSTRKLSRSDHTRRQSRTSSYNSDTYPSRPKSRVSSQQHSMKYNNTVFNDDFLAAQAAADHADREELIKLQSIQDDWNRQEDAREAINHSLIQGLDNLRHSSTNNDQFDTNPDLAAWMSTQSTRPQSTEFTPLPPLNNLNSSIILNPIKSTLATGTARYTNNPLVGSPLSNTSPSTTKAIAKKVDCTVCGDSELKKEMIELLCNHYYHPTCLADGFRHAIAGGKLFICCDGIPAPVDLVESYVPPQFVTIYKAKIVERSTPNPIYCAKPGCAAFIPPTNLKGPMATCPKCSFVTCSLCKNPEHKGICPPDKNGEMLLKLAGNKHWTQCQRCKAMVERDEGCLHMTCTCGHEFCYSCGGVWKTCGGKCPRKS